MKEVIDRVPTRPNRIKLTSESDGSINYYAWERADEPITDGTPINKELFDSIGTDITSLQQTTQTNTSNIATNTSDIQAIKSHDDEQDTNIANLNNATRINLLRPTLETKTSNGVTFTDNGGTYTLNGTATSNTYAIVASTINIKKGNYRLLGCAKGGSNRTYCLFITANSSVGLLYDVIDTGDGSNFTITNDGNIRVTFQIISGTTIDNLLFKPMITPNLNATYDDFVSYEDSLATNKVIATKPVTLGTSWTQDTTNGYYTQSVAFGGITSKDNPTVDVVLSGTLENMESQQEEWGKILKIETSTDTLTFYVSEATTVSLSVMVKGV